MPSDFKPEPSGDGERGDIQAADTLAAEAALRARLSRKRTKTGCLTCRKRRIKCGEERPVCGNCIRSKRPCEGYVQRVVFKTPAYDYHPAPNGGAHITFQADPYPSAASPFHRHSDHGPPVDDLPTRQPPPFQHFDPTSSATHHRFAGQVPVPSHHPYHANQQHMPEAEDGQYPLLVTLPTQQHFHPPNEADSYSRPTGRAPWPAQPSGKPTGSHKVPFDHIGASSAQPGVLPPALPDHSAWRTVSSPSAPSQPMTHPPPMPAESGTPLHSDAVSSMLSPHDAFVPGTSWAYVPRSVDQQPIHSQSVPNGQPRQVQFNAYSLPHHQTAFNPSEPALQLPIASDYARLLTDAAVEAQDDDYYDVQSDDEMDVDTSAAVTSPHERDATFGKMMTSNQFRSHEMQIRRYDTFLSHGMLDTYRVERVANPLRNPATARVFAHFISATGPSLSVFERHPANSSVLFTDGVVPFSQQALWTYTMPMAALHNQGLLHAMLALASLHIARLQGGSVTPSMQHYAWSLKRIHNAVANRKKRLQLTTIAASMLLGFFEIMTADHMKWNMHLAGAKQLIVETDFSGMMRDFKRMKTDRRFRAWQNKMSKSSPLSPTGSLDHALDQIPDIDEDVLSRFLGRSVRYSDQGYVVTNETRIPPTLDLARFEILKDLFWWYCRQDAYQSIISGNPLLMDYSRWAACPPRAPLGKADAVYGSCDHLMLLLGRIADFAAKDRVRKLKQVELNGGKWIPPPGMNIPRPPQPARSPKPSTNQSRGEGLGPATAGHTPESSTSGPTFYGMAPPPRADVHMPAPYESLDDNPSPPHQPHFFDLQAALEEYGRIRAALAEFAASLGEAFEPLDDDCQPPLHTPFGTALFYRSYDIGCLWAIYNMCAIIAIRSHPHCHPAAHAAADIAAKETAFFANQIGRIAAGIVPGPANRPLNPSLGAALCESCMPSFFAAVQYRRPEERHETVLRIYGIGLRTGWGTAEVIANGCETAWVKAAQAGRGPPYTRVVRPRHSDDPRLNGSWERLDPRAQPDERDEGDRRLVRNKPNARLNWAIGIMGMEDDV